MNTYIIDSIRTPIANFGGSLKDVRTDDLAAIPIRELLKRNDFDPAAVDDVTTTSIRPSTKRWNNRHH